MIGQRDQCPPNRRDAGLRASNNQIANDDVQIIHVEVFRRHVTVAADEALAGAWIRRQAALHVIVDERHHPFMDGYLNRFD